MATRSLPRQTRPAPPQRYPRGNSGIGPRPIPVDWQRAGAYWRQQTELKTAHLPTLGAMLAPEQNSFGVLRLAMALAVLVSHCFYLWYGTSTAEPLYKWTGYTLGQHGVQVFFFLSGVLVAQSLATSQSVRDYAIARGLRIFPALIACVLVTTLVLGVWLTTLDVKSYLNSREVAAYVLKTISLSTGSATLPGVFESTPVPGVVNSSLWTLKYEVLCYIMLAAVGFVAIQSKRPQLVAGIALAIWFLVMLQQRPQLQSSSPFSQVMLYFSLFFGSGVAAYALRDKIKLSGHLAMLFVLIAVWANKTNFQEVSLALALGYGSLWLATLRFGGLRNFTNHSDYSYGVYIYGVPVTQAILTLHPNMNLMSLIGFTLAGVFLAAFMSWELIEKPALRFKRVLSPRTANGAAESIVAVTRRSAAVVASVAGVEAAPTDIGADKDLARSRAAIEAQVAKIRADRLGMAARQANALGSRLKAEELAELRTRLALRRSATARPNGRGHG